MPETDRLDGMLWALPIDAIGTDVERALAWNWPPWGRRILVTRLYPLELEGLRHIVDASQPLLLMPPTGGAWEPGALYPVQERHWKSMVPWTTVRRGR